MSGVGVAAPQHRKLDRLQRRLETRFTRWYERLTLFRALRTIVVVAVFLILVAGLLARVVEPQTFTSLGLERSPAEVGPWLAVNVDVRDDAGMTVAEDKATEAGQTYFYRLVGTTGNDWINGEQALKLLLAYVASIVYMGTFYCLGVILTARSKVAVR